MLSNKTKAGVIFDPRWPFEGYVYTVRDLVGVKSDRSREVYLLEFVQTIQSV